MDSYRLLRLTVSLVLIVLSVIACGAPAITPSPTPVPPTPTNPPTDTPTPMPPTVTPPPTIPPSPTVPLPQTVEEVREIEGLLLQKILEEGVGERFVIKELMPERPVKEGGLTISGSGGSVIISEVFPGDLTPPEDLRSAETWRFSGDITRGEDDEYTFVGEGDTFDLLTFAQIPGIGFVYLRGKGRVTLPNGEEVKLGY